MIEEELEIRQFAKKHVIRLSADSSLWDVVEMMNDFNIRHVPVVRGSHLLGVINPLSMMETLCKYDDEEFNNITAGDMVSQDFMIVHDHVPLLDIIQEISRRQYTAVLVMNDSSFHGIYTELDVISSNYLWSKLEDFDISSSNPIGMPINEFSCIASNSSIISALTLMCHLKSDIMGILDEHSKTLTGTLSFMDIIRNVLYQNKELGVELPAILTQPINTIFPQSGLYLREPQKLSEIRQLMFEDSIYLTILLDELGYPTKMISINDLINLYTQAMGMVKI